MKEILWVMIVLLTGCASVPTTHSPRYCDHDSLIFTKREIETRSWSIEPGSPAKYISSKVFHFSNHNDLIAVSYGSTNGVGSRCVDFYADGEGDQYILLAHDYLKLPIESIESEEQNGRFFIMILRSDKQTGAHAKCSYELTDHGNLVSTMSYFEWNEKP